MDHIVGLTARGVECATKLHEQFVRGLITYSEFADELSTVRRNNALPGHMWVITLEGWIFTKVIARSDAYLPDLSLAMGEDEDAGFHETEEVHVHVNFV